MLIGWPHILHYLRTGKTSGKDYPEVDAETVEKLTAAGLPVKYIPELDNLPRITESDVLKWMKAREWSRICNRASNNGGHLPEYSSLWL